MVIQWTMRLIPRFSFVLQNYFAFFLDIRSKARKFVLLMDSVRRKNGKYAWAGWRVELLLLAETLYHVSHRMYSASSLSSRTYSSRFLKRRQWVLAVGCFSKTPLPNFSFHWPDYSSFRPFLTDTWSNVPDVDDSTISNCLFTPRSLNFFKLSYRLSDQQISFHQSLPLFLLDSAEFTSERVLLCRSLDIPRMRETEASCVLSTPQKEWRWVQRVALKMAMTTTGAVPGMSGRSTKFDEAKRNAINWFLPVVGRKF